jgi:hypothetical protein
MKGSSLIFHEKEIVRNIYCFWLDCKKLLYLVNLLKKYERIFVLQK